MFRKNLLIHKRYEEFDFSFGFYKLLNVGEIKPDATPNRSNIVKKQETIRSYHPSTSDYVLTGSLFLVRAG